MDNFSERNTGLIEPQTVLALIHNNPGRLRLVDATYSDAGAHQHSLRRIHNAVFFDIDAVADHSSPLPHMLPPAREFAEAVSNLGISDEDTVIVYDQGGISMAAARAWWSFRVFGHGNVWVLNGGLPYWDALGYPVNTMPLPPPAPVKGNFKAKFQPRLVRNKSDILKTLKNQDALIVDARSAARFTGQVPEPRPGLRAGHIPGSYNAPFTTLINPQTGQMKSEEELTPLLSPLLNDGRPLITSCGSGVTACVLALGFFSLGRRDVAVYDGSWSEWGREDAQTPVEILS